MEFGIPPHFLLKLFKPKLNKVPQHILTPLPSPSLLQNIQTQSLEWVTPPPLSDKCQNINKQKNLQFGFKHDPPSLGKKSNRDCLVPSMAYLTFSTEGPLCANHINTKCTKILQCIGNFPDVRKLANTPSPQKNLQS